MSNRCMSWVLDELTAPVTRTQFCVLITLADAAGLDDTCWPGLALIARRSRMSIATARRAIDDLVALGVIERRSGGGRSSSRYRLLVNRERPSLPEFVGEHLNPAHGEHAHSEHPARASGEHPACSHLSTLPARDEQAARAPGEQAACPPGEQRTPIEPSLNPQRTQPSFTEALARARGDR